MKVRAAVAIFGLLALFLVVGPAVRRPTSSPEMNVTTAVGRSDRSQVHQPAASRAPFAAAPRMTSALTPPTVTADDPRQAGWLAEVRQRIEQDGYAVQAVRNPDGSAAHTAINRAQGLRATFGAQGIEVAAAVGGATSWRWQWTLAAIGRSSSGSASSGHAERTLSATRSEKNRVEHDWEPGVREWYVNDRAGIEQGFILAERPAGEGNLVVSGRVRASGGLRMDASEAGVTWRLDGRDVLRYNHLRVTDAYDQEVRAWIEVARVSGEESEVRLVVDDTDPGVGYPLTIDPLLSSPAWTYEGSQTDEYLGSQHGVASAGDVNGDGYGDVIVGADAYESVPGDLTDEGRAYVFAGSATGLSTTPLWTARGNALGAVFGSSVAGAGDVDGDGYDDVIVGMQGADGAFGDEGAALLFLGSPSGPSASADWIAYGGQASAHFGSSVAGAGDTNGDGFSDVIVGAPLFDSPGFTDDGKISVFLGSATGLASTPVMTYASGVSGAVLGTSVAGVGDVNGDGYGDVLAGAPYLTNGNDGEGKVYLFLGSLTSGPDATPDWSYEGNQDSAYVGHSVGGAGDVNGDGYADIIVGSPVAPTKNAMVFYGAATPTPGIGSSPDWQISRGAGGMIPGASVAGAGDVNGDGFADVIVGDECYENGQSCEGGAYVYYGSASGISATADWAAEGDQVSARYGAAVASAGDVNGDGFGDVIVSAKYYDGAFSGGGKVWVYHGSPAAPATAAFWTTESNQSSAELGFSVATAGDVNGDGHADIVVGARKYDNGETDEGKVLVFHGSATGPPALEDWSAESNQGSALLASRVATAGDVNGDGYADLIVGAANDAYVFHGSATGLAATPAWTASSGQAGSSFGISVASAGDVNGDGYADVIVGAYTYDNGETDEGRAYVYLGSASGLAASPAWMAEGDQATAYFGYSVAGVGDVNGDGYSDVIVGAYQYDGGLTDEGRVFVYYGSATGLGTAPAWTADSESANAHFGVSVAGAGDVNGDGFSDAVVGARKYNTWDGRAYVYYGSAGGLSDTPDWQQSPALTGQFGISVATAGDVNGDGYADVIVGAHQEFNGQTAEGLARLYLGSASGLSTSVGWTGEENLSSAYYGFSVATAGDVNGDGFADLLVGAYGAGDQANEGRAYLYLGNGNGNTRYLPVQLRGDNGNPVQPLGLTGTSARFQVIARSPAGRTRVKLQWEIKPVGTAFDLTGLGISSAWVDTTLVGTDLQEVVSGLLPSTLYHWRARLVSFSHGYGRWFSTGATLWPELDFRTTTSEATVTPTVTETATATETATVTETATSTETATATDTATATVTETATRTATPTITATAIATVTPGGPTLTPSPTSTQTGTATATATRTQTATVTATATSTRTATMTSTATSTASATATRTATQTPTPNLSTGLVAHYQFELNALDSSGQLNHGTAMGSVSYVTGLAGRALSLSGSGYVDVPHTASLDASTELTLAAWVKLSNPQAAQSIVGNLDPTGLNGYLLGVNAAVAEPQVYDTAGALFTNALGSVPASQWTHLTVTWKSGGSLVVYVNGTSAGAVAASTNPIAASSSVLRIGAAPWSASTQRVSGQLDELRIYTRAVSRGDRGDPGRQPDTDAQSDPDGNTVANRYSHEDRHSHADTDRHFDTYGDARNHRQPRGLLSLRKQCQR